MIINRLSCNLHRDSLLLLVRRHFSKKHKRVDLVGASSFNVRFRQGFVRFHWEGSYYRVSLAGVREDWDGYVATMVETFAKKYRFDFEPLDGDSADDVDASLLEQSKRHFRTIMSDDSKLLDDSTGDRIINRLVVKHPHRVKTKELLLQQFKEMFGKAVMTRRRCWLGLDLPEGKVECDWLVGKLQVTMFGGSYVRNNALMEKLFAFASKYGYTVLSKDGKQLTP